MTKTLSHVRSWIRPLGWLLVLAFVPAFSPFRVRSRVIDEANRQYAAGNYKEAARLYEQAERKAPGDYALKYDRGLAWAKTNDPQHAKQAFTDASASPDPALKAKALYNLGVMLHQEKKFAEAATAYRSALGANPDLLPAKWNLELTLRKKEEQKQKEQEQQSKPSPQNQDKKPDQSAKPQDTAQKDKPNSQNQPSESQRTQAKQEESDREKAEREAKNKNERPQAGDQKEAAKLDKGGDPRLRQRIDQVLDALDRDDKNLQRDNARRELRDMAPPSADW
jgi:tetratricopeptide (TPR) repeat protein